MHVAGPQKNGRRKAMNFELNLVPFIDVLSTCICFLLVTAVFINLGSFQVNQAVGSSAAKTEKPTGSVTLSFGAHGDVRFQVKDVAQLTGSRAITTIPGERGQVNFKGTQEWIKAFASQYGEVKTVLLMPNPASKYDDMIQMMAQLKGAHLDQIGIAPL
jgi:biopolymer transport protein ExbD